MSKLFYCSFVEEKRMSVGGGDKRLYRTGNNVNPHFLGVTSFDRSIPRPYKVLRNAIATAGMTGGFVFVT